MVYESGEASIPGNNNECQNIGEFCPNLDPDDSNVVQFISNFAKNVETTDQQFMSILNHLDNPFPASIEPTKEFTNRNIYGSKNLNQPTTWDVTDNSMISHGFVPLMSSDFHNSDSSMSTIYNDYNSASINSSSSQYFGGTSHDDRISAENFYKQLPIVEGQYRSSIGGKQTAYHMGPETSMNNVQSVFSSQCFGGTFHDDRISAENFYKQLPIVEGQYRISIGGKQTAYHMGPETSMNNVQSVFSSQCFGGTSHDDRISAENFYKQLPIVEGQYRSSIGGKQTAYHMGPETSMNNVQSVFSSQCFGGTSHDDRISAENFYKQLPIVEGQYRSSIGGKQTAYHMGPETSMNNVQSVFSSQCSWQPYVQYNNEATPIVPSKYNPQRSNFGTFLQPRVQISAPSKPNQWARQLPVQSDNQMKDHSNVHMNLHLNSWKPVQGQLCVAEESSSHNCYGLNCMETRKRKYDFMESSNKGTLMDVVTRFLKSSAGDRKPQELPVSTGELPPLEQWSNNSVSNEEVSEVKSKLLNMASGPEVSSKVTESAMCNNHISKGPDVNCELNTVSYDYESVLESMQGITPSVDLADCDVALESEKTDTKISSSHAEGSGSGSGNIKKTSASLADSFTAPQIIEHLSSCMQHNKEILENTTPSVSHNQCQLCSMDKLPLSPTPIYCSSCELRIKQKVKYHRSSDESTNTQHCFCMDCFKRSCGDTILLRGVSFSKANLQESKNDDEKEDSWVQCDRCQHWQHRICGLYNNERDAEGNDEYICPKCRLVEMNPGKGVLLPQTVLAAKDLPRTNLSDHIEHRLYRRMRQERQEFANVNGIELEKVPEAEGLVVRVVVSVDKQLEVKQQFRDIFQLQDYPEKFAYRSKLMLLFQNIQGVDLCLFGMYVQEFGSECDGPNNRCVYISYLDSVKYFQPERITASGESLRTFVYHEILIGYLEHCKKRGFATCYIWSCPMKLDDYIFYCHPKTQKTPQQDKLRKWYKLMLKKAAEDGIVVAYTNLYDLFFDPKNQGNNIITAERLPYFDGDYWSLIAQIESKKLEEKGGLCSNSPTRQTLVGKAPETPTKGDLAMKRLRQTIKRSKENYMVVQLQHMCTYCHEVILSGSRWFCSQCNHIQSCSRCFDTGKLLSGNRMHTCQSGNNSPLSEAVLRDVPIDTKDNDGVLLNTFLETRDDFLNKCQKSLYQFDTLNNAKYSSMMILYHLTEKLVDKPILTHNLTNPSTEVTIQPKNENPEKQNAQMLKVAVDALVHTCQCKNIQCSYPYCQVIRKLIRHASICTVRVRNGCKSCQQAWWILRNHAHNCTDSNCRIPLCMTMRKDIATFASSSENKQDPTRSQQ